MMRLLLRILLLPFGVVCGLWEIAKVGARDISNRIRFPGAIVGHGACIDEHSVLEPNTRIYEGVYVNGSSVGRYTYIGRDSFIQNASVGRFCSIATDVLVGLAEHPIDRFSTSPVFYKKNCPLGNGIVEKDTFEDYKRVSIGHDVWIGARAVILGGVNVGNGAVIAANAVVTKDVPDYAVVAGTPAKLIRTRLPESHRARLLQSNWWDFTLDELRSRVDDLNGT